MTCDVISTGSKGNAAVIGGEVLIDCGIPYSALMNYVKGLRLVLLTHIHGDHFNRVTIRRLHQERPTLRFGCCEWLVGPLLEAGVVSGRIDVYEPGDVYCYGDMSLEAFPLTHDVENCGYKLDVGGKRILYATDTGTLDGVESKGYDLYMIEANHTEAELEARIKRKTEMGEFVYEYRAAVSHLSKERADAWLESNATPGKSRVVYLHGHAERNEVANVE